MATEETPKGVREKVAEAIYAAMNGWYPKAYPWREMDGEMVRDLYRAKADAALGDLIELLRETEEAREAGDRTKGECPNCFGSGTVGAEPGEGHYRPCTCEDGDGSEPRHTTSLDGEEPWTIEDFAAELRVNYYESVVGGAPPNVRWTGLPAEHRTRWIGAATFAYQQCGGTRRLDEYVPPDPETPEERRKRGICACGMTFGARVECGHCFEANPYYENQDKRNA